MTLNQSFYNFCVDIVTLNSRLAGGPLYLTEERIKEQIFNNMTQDLREKVQKSTTMLATLNALPFQKWLNTISKINIRITKMVNENDESKNLGVVTITSPSAVAPGDWDPDDDNGPPPLTIPNLYWQANAVGCDGFFVKIKTMIDNGAHIVLISPEIVEMLGLEKKHLQKPQLINVAMNDKKKKNLEPALLLEFVSLSLSTLDNSWTLKIMNAVIAPGLCMNILLGLPFLVHNRIVVDHEVPSASVKDTLIDLLNFMPMPKVILKLVKSTKRKRLEIKLFICELLKELKWKCGPLKAKIDRLSGLDTQQNRGIHGNFVASIKNKLESLELQQKYDVLEDKLKTEFGKIFELIPHVDELPKDVYC